MFKLVKKEGEGYISAYADGKAKVEFIPGQWISAPKWLRKRGYHITVFGSLEDAKALMMNSADHEIWEVEVEGEICDLPPRQDLWVIREGELGDKFGEWPKGTRMVRRVKLVRRVEIY